jgi:DNA-binding NtrC family response regulator
VILITAHGSINNAVDAMRKGATDYLQKPINFDEVFLRLEKIGHVRDLAKDAGDLREAMCVTEEKAAETIMELELALSELQEKVEEIRRVLSSDMDYEDRIAEVLDIIA